MANNSDNILKQLQQYAIEAPNDAFDNAWERIVIEKEWPEKKKFSQLQEYNVTAPPLNFALLKKKENKQRAAITAVLPLAAKKVAAIIVLVGAATAIYFTLFNKKEANNNEKIGNLATIENKLPGTNNALPSTNDSINPKNEASTLATNKNNVGITNTGLGKQKIGINRKSAKGEKASFGGGIFAPVYDHDLLFTLVSYKGGHSQWKKLFTDAVPSKTITLNKYSWVNLSDNIVAMMQPIYDTKKNGKPTRTAKRTKKKFEKWRKKDEKFFDRNMQKNPVDIIDLSEFIL